MRTVKQTIILTLTILIASCSSRTDNKDFEHNYPKYWDKYTEQQLIDTLYSDTLNVGPDTEGGWTTREFYTKSIKELIADLQDDRNKIDSLYPMTSFDQLTIKELPLGLRTTLTNEQTERLLKIINNPVSFNWGETTYEPKYQMDFLKKGIVVATLTIDDEKLIIKTKPSWPDMRKMKFGGLNPKPFADFSKLINEIKQ